MDKIEYNGCLNHDENITTPQEKSPTWLKTSIYLVGILFIAIIIGMIAWNPLNAGIIMFAKYKMLGNQQQQIAGSY